MSEALEFANAAMFGLCKPLIQVRISMFGQHRDECLGQVIGDIEITVNEIRKLKRGEYIVRGRRDLHGMTGTDALATVRRFIENSRHRGHRCVCIIHGRGLSRSPARGFCSSPRRSGLVRSYLVNNISRYLGVVHSS